MQQEEIKIGDISIPIIGDDDEIYYPISFIMKKVLLKKTDQGGLQKEYSLYIKKFKIDYGINTGGIQNVNCISEDGLKEVLDNSKIGRLSVDQRKAMNVLLEYLHMNVISEDDKFIKTISSELFNKYNEYIKDCITYVLEKEPNIIWQKCTKCDNYYPYHDNFFNENQHSGKEHSLNTICKNCGCTKDSIVHPNNELRFVFNNYGENIYKLYRDHKTIEIYNHWLNINKKHMPKIINAKEDKIKIIKYCYEKGMFNNYKEITAKSVYEVCRFNVYDFMKDIYKELFGVEEICSIEDVKKIIENNEIIISDVYKANYYTQVIRKCHLGTYLKKYCNNDLLEFIMRLYDYKYPAYRFNGGYHKYWDKQDNRDRALKCFIEQDMKVPLDKVPLYITLTALRNNGSNTLYNVCKKYYKNLYEWINEIYLDVFDERDFDINYIRNNFDSIDEAEIHDILNETFKNVIYNPRNTDRTIVISGMIPDWFIFTDVRCYIIEYFGLAVGIDTDNKRISEYQEKTIHKIDKYNNIEDYGKVYIYPDDLRNNFNGLREKLKSVV